MRSSPRSWKARKTTAKSSRRSRTSPAKPRNRRKSAPRRNRDPPRRPRPISASSSSAPSARPWSRRTRRESERRIPSGARKLLCRELRKLVNEVKPLLVSAKRIGREIEEGKRIINGASQAGKGRDIERAVTLIADARRTLDVGFVDFIGGQNDAVLPKMRPAERGAGGPAGTPEPPKARRRPGGGGYDAGPGRAPLAPW